MPLIDTSIHGAIHELRLARPPVNALSPELCEALAQALDDAVAGLILKVQQGFPLVSGEVLRSQGARVTLNIGRADGVTEHSRFLVIRAPSAARLAEGRLALIGERPVQAEIERLQSNSSFARIVPPDADALVKEGDYVYAR